MKKNLVDFLKKKNKVQKKTLYSNVNVTNVVLTN